MTSQAAVTRTFQVLLIVLSLVHMVLSKSSPGSLYIHPCAKGKGKSVDISPSQANQVLSHLLDVPGELLGASAGNRDVWDWVDHQQGGKKAVQDLFQNEKQRSVILFSDLDAEDAQGEGEKCVGYTDSILLTSKHLNLFRCHSQSNTTHSFDRLTPSCILFRGSTSLVWRSHLRCCALPEYAIWGFLYFYCRKRGDCFRKNSDLVARRIPCSNWIIRQGYYRDGLGRRGD